MTDKPSNTPGLTGQATEYEPASVEEKTEHVAPPKAPSRGLVMLSIDDDAIGVCSLAGSCS
jgi:hypothetical protein